MPDFVLDKDKEDNLPLSWKVKRKIVPTSSKRNEKETDETVPKKSPYLTNGTTTKLMSDDIKESKVRTFVGED